MKIQNMEMQIDVKQPAEEQGKSTEVKLQMTHFAWYRNKRPEILCTILGTFSLMKSDTHTQKQEGSLKNLNMLFFCK